MVSIYEYTLEGLVEPTQTLSAGSTAFEALVAFLTAPGCLLVLADADNRFLGAISKQNLSDFLRTKRVVDSIAGQDYSPLLTKLEDVPRSKAYAMQPTAKLVDALSVMNESDGLVTELVVVNEREEVQGTLRRQTIVSRLT